MKSSIERLQEMARQEREKHKVDIEERAIRQRDKAVAAHQEELKKDIHIREVTVAQTWKSKAGNPLGEFNLDTIVNPPLAKLAAKTETDDHLIARVMERITEAADKAEAIHKKYNMLKTPVYKTNADGQYLDAGDQIVADKKDAVVLRYEDTGTYKDREITRLSFSEFSFYPYKERIGKGYSEDAFKKIVAEVYEKAKTMPPNLHMLLASFPVINAKNELDNMTIYIECGKDPIIHIVPKAMPSRIDAEYPGTKMTFLGGGSRSETFVKDLDVNLKKFQGIYDRNANTAKLTAAERLEAIDALKDLRKFIDSNSDFTQYPEYTKLRDNIEKVLNEFKNPVVARYTEKWRWIPPGNVRTYNDWGTSIKKDTEDFSKKVALMSKQHETNTKDKMKKDELMWKKVNEKGVMNTYGGNIQCTTQDGTKFTTAIDVCLDHAYGIAKKGHEREVQQTLGGTGEILSRLSHVVTSNTIGIEAEHRIGTSVTHVDPYQQLVRANDPTQYVSKDKVSRGFGGDATLLEHAPQLVEKLASESELVESQKRLNKLIVLRDHEYYKNFGTMNKLIDQEFKKLLCGDAGFERPMSPTAKVEADKIVVALKAIAEKDFLVSAKNLLYQTKETNPDATVKSIANQFYKVLHKEIEKRVEIELRNILQESVSNCEKTKSEDADKLMVAVNTDINKILCATFDIVKGDGAVATLKAQEITDRLTILLNECKEKGNPGVYLFEVLNLLRQYKTGDDDRVRSIAKLCYNELDKRIDLAIFDLKGKLNAALSTGHATILRKGTAEEIQKDNENINDILSHAFSNVVGTVEAHQILEDIKKIGVEDPAYLTKAISLLNEISSHPARPGQDEYEHQKIQSIATVCGELLGGEVTRRQISDMLNTAPAEEVGHQPRIKLE